MHYVLRYIAFVLSYYMWYDMMSNGFITDLAEFYLGSDHSSSVPEQESSSPGRVYNTGTFTLSQAVTAHMCPLSGLSQLLDMIVTPLSIIYYITCDFLTCHRYVFTVWPWRALVTDPVVLHVPGAVSASQGWSVVYGADEESPPAAPDPLRRRETPAAGQHADNTTQHVRAPSQYISIWLV